MSNPTVFESRFAGAAAGAFAAGPSAARMEPAAKDKIKAVTAMVTGRTARLRLREKVKIFMSWLLQEQWTRRDMNLEVT
jgi:hypothetical protein